MITFVIYYIFQVAATVMIQTSPCPSKLGEISNEKELISDNEASVLQLL